MGRTAQHTSSAVLRTAKAKPIRPRARPPAPAFSVRCAPRTAIPNGIALFALNLSSPPAEAQRAPSSCSPPQGVAANCAAQRAARARPTIQPDSQFKTRPQFCRGRPVAHPPSGFAAGRQGRRFGEPRYSLSVQAGRSLRGLKRALRVAGLPWGGVRPARLCESQEHSPKLAPVPCPVSASLRLRCRSATLPSPAAILAELAHRQPAEYAILRGRETTF